MQILTSGALGLVVGASSAIAAIAGPAGTGDPLTDLGISGGEVFTPTIVMGDEAVRIDVLLGGEERELELVPHNLRADSFAVWADRGGGELEPVEIEPPKTYRGRILGEVETEIAASIIDGELSAFIIFGDALWAVQPAAGGVHVSYRAADVLPVDGVCGVDERFDLALPPRPGDEGDLTGEVDICVPAALTAFDADFEFFDWAGSEQRTVDEIELVMNAVDVIYHREVLMGHLIGEMIIRTSPNDPYSGDIFDRLDQMLAHWNGQQQGVQRQVAHLFSGGPWDGVIGLAYLGVPCVRPDLAYGVSISNFSGNMLLRVGLTAHELGHNWGAGHCDGDSDCAIMCPGIGGCSEDVESFGSRSRNSIQSFVGSIADLCLGEECFDAEPPASGIVFGNTLSGEIGSLDETGSFVPGVSPGFNVDGMAYDRNRKIYFLTDTRDRASLYTMREFDFFVSRVGPFVGASRIAGLAYDPNADRLYGMDQAVGQLYVIQAEEVDDELVAMATPIGPARGGLVGALAFDEDQNILYGIDDFGGSILYEIDTTDGARTEVGELGLVDCDGLCWRPADQLLYTIDGQDQSMYVVTMEPEFEVTIVNAFRDFGIASTFGMAAGSEVCLADIDESGEVDADDFFAYLDLFAAGDPGADLTGSGDPNDPGYGVPDGSIDAEDFFFYLDAFVRGCG